ncbi:MAG: PP2C family protein-serine/threonine phosphatase [Acidobacteria bacterium]|jgi:sigma-B regulation protein RsbU (phosphoserine phosphatase)|nr:PP2C family protein-serine/threonine phosphatase [Acidobacteriota bacterium]
MDRAKHLYRRLDQLFGELPPRRTQAKMVEAFLEQAFAKLGEDLHLSAGLLYVERRDGFTLARAVGDAFDSVAEVLDPSQDPLAEIIEHRVYIFGDNAGAAGTPRQLGLLPQAPAAGLVVGQRPQRYCLLFVLVNGWEMEELDFALNTIRAALDARLVDARVRGSFREAEEIQRSLLAEEPPVYPGYEVACRSVAAEEVGGDFYDFHDLGEDILGIAIGDASGHGLPAALVVRDVVTGLRMGIEKDLKIVHVFAKLNRVIHRSRLSSRFVSVFYGELEADGNLVYVNAGHPPPILFFRDPKPGRARDQELSVGGTVVGPLPEVRFRRGFARIRTGEVLVMCTDGILERPDPSGEFFGTERLRQVVLDNRGASAQEILDRLYETVTAHGADRPWDDDATVVVVRRLEEPGPGEG